jgi:hypothetical protein
MHPLIYPFLLPTLCMLEMMSACGPWLSRPGPGGRARDTLRSDLE